MSRITEIHDLDHRKFSALVDQYIRGTISEADRTALESPELLMRMYLDLISTEKGVRGQFAILKSNYILSCLDADGNVTAEDEALRVYRSALRPKQKFSLGLNDTMAHVAWLVWETYPKEFAIVAERDAVIAELEIAKTALHAHRKAALKDDDGWLPREQKLWEDAETIIGKMNLHTEEVDD
jgi:hypothetical protein